MPDFSTLLGLTQPSFGDIGGNMFGGQMSQFDPQGANFQQGFLGRGIGRGIGSLFGDAQGQVDLGGGNYFKSGRGFWNASEKPGFAGGSGVNAGMDFGSFFGSLFGGQ